MNMTGSTNKHAIALSDKEFALLETICKLGGSYFNAMVVLHTPDSNLNLDYFFNYFACPGEIKSRRIVEM
jgi:hypothetical protein